MSDGDPAIVGVVAAGHPESARAGAAVLAVEGNAVDAACAAAAAAGICETPLTGPGAGGFLVTHHPDGSTSAIDFFVAAPGLGPDGRRLDAQMLESFTVPFGDAEQEFHIGPASVAVPGMMQGLAHAVRTQGRLSLQQVLAPARALALNGVVVTPQIEYLFDILATMLCHTPEARAIFAPGDRLLRAGDVLHMPELADAFDEVASTGGATMVNGALAKAICAHLARYGGLVTSTDLEEYRVIERVPLVMSHHGVTLATNPPPSAGGALIFAALGAVSQDAVSDDAAFYGALAHAGAHANRLRGNDLAQALHDPEFVDRLLRAPVRKPTGTTNVAVIDADGMMASLSSSCGSGGGVVVPGTGILLNNMLGEADLNPGGFGRIPPGTRMTSMMAPTIAFDAHRMIALGSAGSNRLRSAILQTLVAVLDRDLPLHEAVDLPRIHHEGDGLDVEFGVPDAVCDILAADYRLRRWQSRNLFFGGVSAVGRRHGRLEGAGDPRRGGAAAGVTRHGEVIDL